jgi:hypothetical protein
MLTPITTHVHSIMTSAILLISINQVECSLDHDEVLDLVEAVQGRHLPAAAHVDRHRAPLVRLTV